MARTNHRVIKNKETNKPESPSHKQRRDERRLIDRIEELYYEDGLEADEYDEYERFEKIVKRK